MQEESTTFSGIFEAVRREQAERELRGKRNIGEIAFALGSSSLGAFDGAFKRWRGMLSREYRARDTGDGG
ncbi:MAG: helix-turn-helix domain-containing protein [Polyangiaceae bacterium]|nr:helix-turn-helix domain-containing protein [Polyangiaceae bacterium]